MRKVKFRAWDKTNKVMEYNVNVNQGTAVKEGYQWYSIGNTVYDSKLMQYTGLLDKNGKEIYEGDILKTRIGGYEQESPYVVEDMRKLYFELKRDDSYYRIQETEVLGNIYDNPELYKERENGSEGTEDV